MKAFAKKKSATEVHSFDRPKTKKGSVAAKPVKKLKKKVSTLRRADRPEAPAPLVAAMPSRGVQGAGPKQAARIRQLSAKFHNEDMFDVIESAPAQTAEMTERSSSREVWAINLGLAAIGQPCRLCIDAVSRTGKTTAVLLEHTVLPINLTDQVPKESLLNSPNFLQMLVPKQENACALIKIIPAAWARMLLTHPDAATERNRIAAHAQQQQASRSMSSTAPKEESAQGWVQQLILQLEHNSVGPEEALLTLRQKKGQLKKVDLKELIAQVASPKIKRWASDQSART